MPSRAVTVLSNPVPLNSERHRNLKIAPSKDGFSFATKTNSVPLMGVEFMDAATDGHLVSLSNVQRLVDRLAKLAA